MADLSLTVSMCTYNGSRYLGEQLQSILEQDQHPCEMVICDDGSTDSTMSLLVAFASEAPFPVRLEINSERLGPAKNFEKAIGLCQGDVIVLADQDDIWRQDKIKRLAETFKDHPDAVYAFSDAEMENETISKVGDTLWKAVGLQRNIEAFVGSGQLAMLLRRNYITGAALAFRASFRDVALPIPVGWMHDYWIVLLGSTFFYGVPVPERLFVYRRHASQVCGWRKKTFFEVVKDSLTAAQGDWLGKVETFRRFEDRVASVLAPNHCPPDRFNLIQQKALHLSSRARIRSSWGYRRLGRVLAEVSTGRYRRFSPSWHSIVRDL